MMCEQILGTGRDRHHHSCVDRFAEDARNHEIVDLCAVDRSLSDSCFGGGYGVFRACGIQER